MFKLQAINTSSQRKSLHFMICVVPSFILFYLKSTRRNNACHIVYELELVYKAVYSAIGKQGIDKFDLQNIMMRLKNIADHIFMLIVVNIQFNSTSSGSFRKN